MGELNAIRYIGLGKKEKEEKSSWVSSVLLEATALEITPFINWESSVLMWGVFFINLTSIGKFSYYLIIPGWKYSFNFKPLIIFGHLLICCTFISNIELCDGILYSS